MPVAAFDHVRIVSYWLSAIFCSSILIHSARIRVFPLTGCLLTLPALSGASGWAQGQSFYAHFCYATAPSLVLFGLVPVRVTSMARDATQFVFYVYSSYLR